MTGRPSKSYIHFGIHLVSRSAFILPNLQNCRFTLPNPSECEKPVPAGYSAKCKTCNSSHRVKIEKWHKGGKSPETIEALLLEKFGVKISCRAIRNHLDEHYNVSGEAREQYQKSQANLEKEAGERISEIEILESVVSGKHALHKKLEAIFTNLLRDLEKEKVPGEPPHLPMAYVSLYTGCAAEIRQAMKTKQELLGEDFGAKKAGAMQSWVDLMLEDEGEAK